MLLHYLILLDGCGLTGTYFRDATEWRSGKLVWFIDHGFDGNIVRN